MLNRLPKDPGTWADLVAQIGAPSAAQIARALGVSRRTVERWNREEAPRHARLCLWWLSHEGHSVWDSEMANRTALAFQVKNALWREVSRLSQELEQVKRSGPVLRAYGPPANDPSCEMQRLS